MHHLFPGKAKSSVRFANILWPSSPWLPKTELVVATLQPLAPQTLKCSWEIVFTLALSVLMSDLIGAVVVQSHHVRQELVIKDAWNLTPSKYGSWASIVVAMCWWDLVICFSFVACSAYTSDVFYGAVSDIKSTPCIVRLKKGFFVFEHFCDFVSSARYWRNCRYEASFVVLTISFALVVFTSVHFSCKRFVFVCYYFVLIWRVEGDCMKRTFVNKGKLIWLTWTWFIWNNNIT